MKSRSLVKIGNSYYVSLPKKWVISQGLNEVKEVYVNPRSDGVIEILPSTSETSKPSVRRIKLTKFIEREIFSAYLAGYDTIIVEINHNSEKTHTFSSVLERVQHLLVGLEIVEESDREVILQCFIREDYEITQIIARMEALARSMYVDAVKSSFMDNPELARSVIRRDDRLDRLYFLTVRLIRKLISKPIIDSLTRVKLLDYRLLVRELEEIGDIGEEIALNREEFKVEEKTLRIVEKIAKVERKLVNAVLRGEGCGELDISSLVKIKNILEKELINKNMHSIYSYLLLIVKRLEDIADLVG